jgi:hypothetical protein
MERRFDPGHLHADCGAGRLEAIQNEAGLGERRVEKGEKREQEEE